ncbi:hypothetical protein L596_000662 [Steinernema carpocapsae]|uniref:Uncharacterized protein n=1 Tax=Steinernema carpocapsae TaxID=34508 RepID=A0A4U8UL69_STECR|nr:hypothetical protein L596_000662 [Steinernema carpocapsae]
MKTKKVNEVQLLRNTSPVNLHTGRIIGIYRYTLGSSVILCNDFFTHGKGKAPRYTDIKRRKTREVSSTISVNGNGNLVYQRLNELNALKGRLHRTNPPGRIGRQAEDAYANPNEPFFGSKNKLNLRSLMLKLCVRVSTSSSIATRSLFSKSFSGLPTFWIQTDCSAT